MKLAFNKVATTAITTTVAFFSITSCTVYLPPTEEPIPSADPILVPGKATTVAPDNKSINNKPIKNDEKSPTTANTEKEKQVVTTLKAEKNSKEPSKQGQTFYVVKPKDTVFAVMRRTGVHWQEIIKLNNLKAPKYTIFPGQNLRIK